MLELDSSFLKFMISQSRSWELDFIKLYHIIKGVHLSIFMLQFGRRVQLNLNMHNAVSYILSYSRQHSIYGSLFFCAVV